MSRLAAALASLFLICPNLALARCATPHEFISPTSGATVPPNPVLFVFLPDWMKDELDLVVTDDEDHPLAHHVERVASSGAFYTYRVEIESARADVIMLESKGNLGRRLRAGYRINRSAKPASHEAIAIDHVTSRSYSWTCSFQATRNFEVSLPAAAYRISWSDSAEAWARGEAKSVVLPRRMAEAFRDSEDTELPETGFLELGYVSCIGKTLAWKEPIWIGVTALFDDGTESGAPMAPLRLDPPPAPTEEGFRLFLKGQ